MRWHRCNRALYAQYKGRGVSVMRDALNLKLEYAKTLHQDIPSSDHFQVCLQLRLAAVQMGLRSLVEVELLAIYKRFMSSLGTNLPKRKHLKKTAFQLSGIHLDKINGLDFRGGTNGNALRVISHCAAWVKDCYGWCMLIRCTNIPHCKLHKFPLKRPLASRGMIYMLYVRAVLDK